MALKRRNFLHRVIGSMVTFFAFQKLKARVEATPLPPKPHVKELTKVVDEHGNLVGHFRFCNMIERDAYNKAQGKLHFNNDDEVKAEKLAKENFVKGLIKLRLKTPSKPLPLP